jgi:hypothetical protein
LFAGVPVLLVSDKDSYIVQRLEALETERQILDEKYNSGALSKQDYERECAKNNFLIAEIKERNNQDYEQNRDRTSGRESDFFDD